MRVPRRSTNYSPYMAGELDTDGEYPSSTHAPKERGCKFLAPGSVEYRHGGIHVESRQIYIYIYREEKTPRASVFFDSLLTETRLYL
jgi:hypothetical protein